MMCNKHVVPAASLCIQHDTYCNRDKKNGDSLDQEEL